MTSTEKPGRNRWLWLLAVGLMLAEFLLFDRMASVHHASIYPRWNDQIQYLRESYTAFEQAKAHGLAAGLKFALGKPALQGTLHDTSALVVFWLTGTASRSAALSLNLLVFLAWQASLLLVIARRSGSSALGWMAFGLVLCLAGPWTGAAGSAVDFRLDHAAMCLMGLISTLALLTRGFRSTRWAVALGVATGILLLERFLTGVYFAVIFLASAVWILCGAERGRRLGNLGLAGLLAAAFALPVFWLNRTAIYTYYWVGHITGAEGAARSPGLDLWHSVQFIGRNLGHLHLGPWFGWTVAAVTTVLLLGFLLARAKPAPGTGPDRDWLYFALAFLLLPAAVLCFHRQKSEYVLGVLAPGLVLLVLWLWAWLWSRFDVVRCRSAARWLPVALAVGVVASGSTYFAQRQLAAPYSDEFRASAISVNAMADYIYAQSQARHLANPYIAVDQIVDFMDAQILQVMCYERHKTWIPFVIQLPNSILEDKDEVMLYRMQLCDYVLLTDAMPGNGYWPYDRQMRRLYPELKAWCEGHLHHTQTFFLFGREMSLYEKRNGS